MHKRVLVVDDVPDWREMLQDLLKRQCEVTTVTTYDEALSIVERGQIELVIVDLRLSPTDENNRQGISLLEKLAEKRINAIVLTGYPEDDIQEEAEEKYMAFDFIDKSVVAADNGIIKRVIDEVFALLESKQRAKDEAIQRAKAGESVSFTDELLTWPLRKFRKGK